MTQFTADIAGMLEIFAIAAGLVLLHRANKEAPAKLLRAAGWVLIVGGIASGLCTSWYWFKYQRAGHFDPSASHSTMEPGSMSGRHGMPGMHSNPEGDRSVRSGEVVEPDVVPANAEDGPPGTRDGIEGEAL